MEPQPQDKPLGAPEHLDVPFELKTVEIVTQDDGAEVGVFEGLASTFGNRDMMGDLVEPGAFSGALARPGAIKMLWQHDARAPIGVWERVRETAAGLEVKGRLVQQAREAFALLKAGAVDALSIGFSVLRGGAQFDRERSLRRIKAVDLWEISVVTFPANPKARVARIKAADVSASWGASRGGQDYPIMTMRDLHNNIAHAVAVAPQTISGSNLVSGDIDLAGFSAAEVVAYLGDIDELGGSPVGAAKLDVKLEHADDDGTGSPGAYANVGLAEVIGPAAVTGGIVASTTGDGNFLEVGYLGAKRFLRVTLVPTALTNGGPVSAWVAKGSPRHAPQ